jgi:hypothetical protein
MVFDVINQEGAGSNTKDVGRYEASMLSPLIGAAKRYFRIDISTYISLQIMIVSYLLYRTVSPCAFDVTTIKHTLMLLAQV